ncbi:MAG: hypothetical protein U9Q22_06375 [Candidatus Altiarchaeota archaeon]|nr:hypothetical protein [Candidatus Altiarchaeota archaeon]
MRLQYYILFLASVVVVFSGCTGFDEAVGTVEEMACDKIDPSGISEEWDRDHCYKEVNTGPTPLNLHKPRKKMDIYHKKHAHNIQI